MELKNTRTEDGVNVYTFEVEKKTTVERDFTAEKIDNKLSTWNEEVTKCKAALARAEKKKKYFEDLKDLIA